MNATDSEIAATLKRRCRRGCPSGSVIALMDGLVGSTWGGLKTRTRLEAFFFAHHFRSLEVARRAFHPFD